MRKLEVVIEIQRPNNRAWISQLAIGAWSTTRQARKRESQRQQTQNGRLAERALEVLHGFAAFRKICALNVAFEVPGSGVATMFAPVTLSFQGMCLERRKHNLAT